MTVDRRTLLKLPLLSAAFAAWPLAAVAHAASDTRRRDGAGITDEMWSEGARKPYEGTIIVARDLIELEL